MKRLFSDDTYQAKDNERNSKLLKDNEYINNNILLGSKYNSNFSSFLIARSAIIM